MKFAAAVRIIGMVTAVACAGRREAVTHETPISRTVRVASGTITLGEPLPREIAAAGTGENVILLPRGAVARAERVIVRTSAANVVSGVTMQYTLGVSFDSMVADYTRSFGAPVRSRLARQGEIPAEVAVWLDSRTELRLTRDPNRGAWTVQSELQDRTEGNTAP